MERGKNENRNRSESAPGASAEINQDQRHVREIDLAGSIEIRGTATTGTILQKCHRDVARVNLSASIQVGDAQERLKAGADRA